MILVNFTCHEQKLAMNACLRKHGTLAERDRAREEWFSNKMQRVKEADPKGPETQNDPKNATNSLYPERWGRPETREGFGTRFLGQNSSANGS
jgi:hypothetical protein